MQRVADAGAVGDAKSTTDVRRLFPASGVRAVHGDRARGRAHIPTHATRTTGATEKVDARGVATSEPRGKLDADRAETARDHERLIGGGGVGGARANERRRLGERVRLAEQDIPGVLSRRSERERARRRRRASRERRGEPRHGRRGGVGDVDEIDADEIDVWAIFASRATRVVQEERRAPRVS